MNPVKERHVIGSILVAVVGDAIGKLLYYSLSLKNRAAVLDVGFGTGSLPMALGAECTAMES